jgi:hypothetical protein
MPYLRLYSQDVPIEQKRVISQKLIEITLRTLQLRAEDRHRISIQFIPLAEVSAVDGFRPMIPRDAGLMLEVLGHDLTERKKRVFYEEAAATLAPLVPLKPKNIVARILGIRADTPRQIALQFKELSPAISDPFVFEAEQEAA